MKTIKNILLAMLLTLPMALTAAYLFKTLDARDGLTSSQINCILKDTRGFIWFGTPAGLYRYDGYTFKNFQCDSQDGSSLPDSYIKSIHEALDGSLWIETQAGYCIYHPKSESFERNMKQVFARMGIERQPDILYIDRHKNLWGYIPNKGVVCYNMQQQLLFEFGYTDDAHGIPQGTVCSISECRDGAVIVYEDGRMACCDVMHQQHTVWTTTEIASNRLRKSKTLKAFADQMNNIWLYGQGTLFVYNPGTDTWDTSVGDYLGLTGTGADHTVNSMAGDRSGNVWVGTDRVGLVRINVNSREIEQVQPTSMNTQKQLAGNVGIQSVYVDNTDLLWIGTEKSGVAYWGKNIYKFEALLNGDITAMAQDASGNVWYGTSNQGVIGYEGSLASRKISAMTATPDGSVWVGTKQNGLTRIKDGNSTHYSLAKDSMRTLIDDHINDLCTDKSGNLWIATDGGLQVYNPKMNTFSSYTRENGKLPTNSTTSLFYVKSNHLLVGTGEGLIVMNLTNTEVQHLTGNTTNLEKFTNNYITEVFEDSRGLVWVGTREGINILNLETDDLDYLTEKQGLCNNNICGIAEDKNANIWLTTSNGVSRVVVQRNHDDNTFSYGLYNYNTSDGLQSNEFNPGSILVKTDGRVLLGGLYGINWVRTRAKDETEALPTVMLTQLFIGEEEVQIGHEYDGRVLLSQSLNESERLELKHNQSTFTIKFAAGNYNQSERLQFKYWLEGHDNDWRNGDALNHGVTFHNLGSGTYTLHVKAISAEGAVSNQERTMTIVVERHWLLSWWMLLIYAIVTIIALYMWKIGMDKMRGLWLKKRAVIGELKRQRESIKQAGDELMQPMASMASIMGNLKEKVERDGRLEEREQLNSLHSKMLQVFDSVTKMQMTLEHPEEEAKRNVNTRYELNSKGELALLEEFNEGLTAEAHIHQTNAPTKEYCVVFIDDNPEFNKFVTDQLRYVYEFHSYENMNQAMEDIADVHPDVVLCKQDMRIMTGSELCNKLKSNPGTEKIKFILMTDYELTLQDIKSLNITLSADDMIAKPFKIEDAIMRINKLLGLGLTQLESNLIEGAETRMLEDRSSSMTTASESIDYGNYSPMNEHADDADDEMQSVEIRIRKNNTQLIRTDDGALIDPKAEVLAHMDDTDEAIGNYTMVDAMERQFLRNIEQYVVQNMSRGQISLAEMAEAMGMGRVPFFHKVRNITGKTPPELVRDLRLKHACILLKRTNINMNELSTNVGFMTAENFINIFKEKFGISPLEYRMKHRK